MLRVQISEGINGLREFKTNTDLKHFKCNIKRSVDFYGENSHLFLRKFSISNNLDPSVDDSGSTCPTFLSMLAFLLPFPLGPGSASTCGLEVRFGEIGDKVRR